MKLLAENSSALQSCIDNSCNPEISIVRRYRNAIRFDDDAEKDLEFKRHLQQTGLREGVRVVEPVSYKGVDLYILDETSAMTTGSLKAIDGCLTAALCLMEGEGRIAFESGGNTGSALTRYGRQAGLETFFFFPEDNLDLLDSRLFEDRNAHLVAVAERRRVKEFTGLFARTAGIRHVPDRSWRFAASTLRGLFILEHMLKVRKYDWLSQTVSAAFGPIGIYNVLNAFRNELPTVPRFLGLQQEGNCPMYKAWKREESGSAGQGQGRLLTRVMYDESPQTYRTDEEFLKLLLLARGDMLTVNGAEFGYYTGCAVTDEQLVELLLSRGIPITLRSGEVVEKTGMIALVGTLKAIDVGVIAPGSSVLCCLTGGVSGADGQARPESTLRSEEDVLDYAGQITGVK